jgi:hypothetical protein
LTCIPCQKARAAIVGAARAISTGDVSGAKDSAVAFRDAVGEKAESLRVRAMTGHRRV